MCVCVCTYIDTDRCTYIQDQEMGPKYSYSFTTEKALEKLISYPCPGNIGEFLLSVKNLRWNYAVPIIATFVFDYTVLCI